MGMVLSKKVESFGLLSGLLQDYHTMLLVNAERSLEVIRCEENSEMFQVLTENGTLDFKTVAESYVEKYVYDDDRDRVKLDIDFNYIKTKIQNGGIYYVGFQQLNPQNRIVYNQFAFAKTEVDGTFVMAIRSIDELMKKELTAITTTERLRQYEKDQQEMEQLFESAGSAPFSMEFNDVGELVFCNWSNTLRRMLGFENTSDFPNDISSWEKALHPEDKKIIIDEFWEILAGKKAKFGNRMRLKHKTEGYKWYKASGVVARREDGTPTLFLGMFTNINDVTLANEALIEQYMIVNALSLDYFNVYLINTKDQWASVIKTNGQVNKSFEQDPTKRYPYDAFCTKFVYERVFKEDVDVLLEQMKLANVVDELSKNQEYVSSFRTYSDGKVQYYQFKYIRLDENDDTKIILGFKNIDALVEATREKENFKKLSEIDQMTNLLNRGSGQRMTEEALKSGKSGMMCILDVDHFKLFNDTYGHNVGDKVLIGVAKCLRKTFRDNDIVFRLGGDEFAIYALNVENEAQGRSILKRFINHLSRLKIDEICGQPITVSVGAIIIDNPTVHSFEELYKKTDSCTYIAKQERGNTMTFFNV